MLLNGAIIESLVQAFDRDGKPAADAGELSRRLAEIRHRSGLFGYDPEGTPLFGPDGNRRGGAGENIVYLRPHFEGDRVLPEATIEVWVSRESVAGAVRPWAAPRRAADGFLRAARGGRGGRPMSAAVPPPGPPAGPAVALLALRPGADGARSCCGPWWRSSSGSRSTTGSKEKTATTSPPWKNGWTRRAPSARRCRRWRPTTRRARRSCSSCRRRTSRDARRYSWTPRWATADKSNEPSRSRASRSASTCAAWGTRRPRCTTASCRCSRRFIASR